MVIFAGSRIHLDNIRKIHILHGSFVSLMFSVRPVVPMRRHSVPLPCRSFFSRFFPRIPWRYPVLAFQRTAAYPSLFSVSILSSYNVSCFSAILLPIVHRQLLFGKSLLKGLWCKNPYGVHPGNQNQNRRSRCNKQYVHTRMRIPAFVRSYLHRTHA